METKEQKAPESGSEKNSETRHTSVIGLPAADGRILIGQDIEIFPDKECTGFSTPGTRAYEARDRRQSGEHFALLCDRTNVPRTSLLSSYRHLKNRNILTLVDAGILDWAPEGCQKFALVFEKPRGRKILESSTAKPVMIANDRLIPAVIRPALSVLESFRNSDMIHGAINLENMYLVGTEGLETVILGECLSGPPSCRQPGLYESASRAMTMPSGRGPGTIKDDLYALGMCVAMMARGENFLAGKTPEQLTQEKIEHGSYGAIIGRERIASGISEFLRGVLNDDADLRWDIDDVLRWLEGRRLTPKQGQLPLKAARPFIFREQKYWDLRSLADAFSKNIPEAAGELEKDQLDLWLKRNFDDKALKTRLDSVWEKEKTSPREKLVACVCMALDPFGPLRFKGISAYPSGFGTALTDALLRDDDIQVFGDILMQQIFSAYINQVFDDLPDSGDMISLFDKCRNTLAQKMPGYGIERVLYSLNPEVPCLSPALKNYYILTPGALLLALEGLSRQAGRPTAPLDRHMIAFISVHEPKMIDSYLGYVNSLDAGTRVIGTLRALTAIQRRFSTGSLPGVVNWLISLTPPLVEKLNDHDLREALTKQIARMTDSGSLTALLNIVDDRELILNDAERFAQARQAYQSLTLEKNEISFYLTKRRNFGSSTGRNAAMILSAVLAVIIIVGYVVLHFTKVL